MHACSREIDATVERNVKTISGVLRQPRLLLQQPFPGPRDIEWFCGPYSKHLLRVKNSEDGGERLPVSMREIVREIIQKLVSDDDY